MKYTKEITYSTGEFAEHFILPSRGSGSRIRQTPYQGDTCNAHYCQQAAGGFSGNSRGAMAETKGAYEKVKDSYRKMLEQICDTDYDSCKNQPPEVETAEHKQ